jgi:hypothetical protein
MRNLNYLLGAAIVLIVIWVLATVTRFIAGALLNLLLFLALILLVVWAVRRFR